MCMGGRYTQSTKEGIRSDIWNWSYNSCEPMWLLEANRFAGKESNTLNLQANSLAPSKLTCNEIWNQLLWTMTVPLLNAGTLLIQLNSFPYISWVAYIVQHCPPSPAASSIQILWVAGIPSTESLSTINSMQFCPKGSGLGVGAQSGAREPLLLGKGRGLCLCNYAEAVHVVKTLQGSATHAPLKTNYYL